jgi:mono/diheme cytochrome c family protein
MRILAAIGALAIVLGLLAGVYFFGGFYNVAAAVDEPVPVNWALTRIRLASISHHDVESAQAPFALDDLSVIREGARQFANNGCVHCHGGPGAKWSKFSEGINPGPPDLKDIANERIGSEIFWVVKNGIRMTGMPSFSKVGLADDQLWQLTAFVKAIPKVSDADYRSWTTTAPMH